MTIPTTPTAETQVRYHERIGAPWWCWAVILGLTFGLALALYVPLGPIAGITTVVAGLISAYLLLVTTALPLAVTDSELRVGRAHIDWRYVGLVATLDAEATQRARTVEADPRAFRALRPLSTTTALTVEIIDDDDPHPYWLVSTRAPEQFGKAIVNAQNAASARDLG